ncbi:glutamate--cysteine ligase [Amycolatopsis sp. cg9]|uniref:carboxylate-amine ligase n=1 Tax=Amycolatopsis sp. cg9 TaxID=3238801 RepID=UPI0035264F2A
MADGGSTVGVEEEFVLADPRSGATAAVAPRVLELLADEPGVQAEFLRFQVETATGVCRSLPQVRADLTRLRRRLAEAAEPAGCVALATGVAPFGAAPRVTADPRYRTLAARFPALVGEAGTCACHVHVGVPSRAAGARVLARLRPWLAALLAISANSPYVEGLDSGWASARYPLWSRWPTARPPGEWRDVADYDAAVGGAVRGGQAIDARSVYFYARLSPRHPTVEVRIADVCLEVADAVLLAGLVRGLVVTALAEERRGAPPPRVPDALVERALRAAARYGLAGPGVDVLTGIPVAHEGLVEDLLAYVRPALRAMGDLDDVVAGWCALRSRGGGAERQRALRAGSATPAEFVARLAAVTSGEDRERKAAQ